MSLLTQTVRTLLPPSLLRQVQLMRYAGNNYECPCCEGTFRTFWPSGETPDSMRDNTLCPRCNSLERHRLLWLYFRAHPDLLQGKKRVLHIAPESIFTRLFAKYPELDYLSADLESPLAMVKMDITQISYPADSFDIILCNHVLEHVPDDLKAMQELCRVLRPDGWAILQSPLQTMREVTYEDFSITDPAEREKHFGQRDHVRLYGRDYGTRLEKAGFNVKVDGFAGEMEAAQRERYRVNPEEDIYFCTKNLSL